MNDDLTNAVAAITKAGELLNIVSTGAINDLPWTEAVTLLARLRAAYEDHIGPVEASLVRHIYLTGEHGQGIEIDGVGPVDITRTSDRSKWDERSAVYAALDTFMERRGGEQPDPAEVVDMVLELVGVGYLRVGALRAYKLNPDDYCEKKPGRPAVRVIR